MKPLRRCLFSWPWWWAELPLPGLALAEERWVRCVEHYPGHSNVVSNAVQFYDARGDSARSLAILRGAREADPSSRQYRALLAERLRQARDVAGAEALLREDTASQDPNVAT